MHVEEHQPEPAAAGSGGMGTDVTILIQWKGGADVVCSLAGKWWGEVMECFCCWSNIQDKLADGYVNNFWHSIPWSTDTIWSRNLLTSNLYKKTKVVTSWQCHPPCNGETNVVSMASCAPCYSAKSSATTSSLRPSSTLTPDKSISRTKVLVLTLAPLLLCTLVPRGEPSPVQDPRAHCTLLDNGQRVKLAATSAGA